MAVKYFIDYIITPKVNNFHSKLEQKGDSIVFLAFAIYTLINV